MNLKIAITILLIMGVMIKDKFSDELKLEVYQTSADGDQFVKKSTKELTKTENRITLHPNEKFQTILGIGGAFTESSAYLLNELSQEKREEVLEAYFSKRGANYSLTRTHMNSCDFSLDHYSYAPVEHDTDLVHFSVEPDRNDIIPMIRAAQNISPEGFKIIASPWTAPPWMKTNGDWNGGELKPEYYDSWADFFVKYLEAYQKEGINIWGLTVENEPLGNDANWESMHYSPETMAEFIKEHLGPRLKKSSFDPRVLIYDQNRGEELEEWAEVLLKDEAVLNYVHGTAVHWYTSTVDWMPASLNFTHDIAPDKHLIHTEACVDAEVPKWKDDAWYWKKEATDWGWDWAPEEQKKDHPKYVPVYRYARDIIGCLNSWVEGWVDWNMVLNKQGGPNLAKNWCVAPVIVDEEKDEVYYTPLYYTLMHFSKFIRPDGIRIGFSNSNEELMTTAVQNKDGSIVVVLLNMTQEKQTVEIELNSQIGTTEIDAASIQTLLIQPA